MSYSDTFQGLDKASQKHESEVVIDLAPDRILHFLGVYVIVLLAVATKVTELAGLGRLSCFPIHENKSALTFINHANKYCWESSEINLSHTAQNTPNISACQQFRANETNLKSFHPNSLAVKRLLQWMPYAMLLEAFLFALPTAYWHFVVGARLMGHLKFIKLLIDDIYESVKTIPAGIYRKKPYDEEGHSLNCWRRYKGKLKPKTKTKASETDGQEDPKNETSKSNQSAKNETSDTPSNEGSERLPLLENDQRTDINADADRNDKEMKNKSETPGRNEVSVKDSTAFIKNTDEDTEASTSAETPGKKGPARLTNEEKQGLKKIHSKSQNKTTSLSSTKFPEDKSKGASDSESIEAEEKGVKPQNARSQKVNVGGVLQLVLENITNPAFIPNEPCETKAAELEKRLAASKSGPSKEGDAAEESEEATNGETDEKTQCDGTRGEGDTNGNFDRTSLCDRHIFSMLCNENYASLQHQPYLKSVAKLTEIPDYDYGKEIEKEDVKILPMKNAILRMFCNKENFKRDSIVLVYYKKCAFSMALASLLLIALTILFIVVLLPTMSAGSFICEIPYHTQCLSCTLTGLIDVYAAFFANWVAVAIYLTIVAIQTNFVRNASDHQLSNFLEEIKPLCDVALIAAHEYAKK